MTNNLDFGLIKLKREGDICDPNDFTWEHDPINGECEQCKKRYQNWLSRYNEQELKRESNGHTS